MAKLSVIYGPVAGGKTAKLIEWIERAQLDGIPSVVCKSLLDVRTNQSLSSSDPALNGRIPALAFHSPWQILEFIESTTSLIVIDEAQFFDLTDIVEVVKKLVGRNDLHLAIAGRDLDHVGNAYPVMSYLLPKADSHVWCVGTCACCGDAAGFTYFKMSGGLKIMVVGNTISEPRCESCFNRGAAA